MFKCLAIFSLAPLLLLLEKGFKYLYDYGHGATICKWLISPVNKKVYAMPNSNLFITLNCTLDKTEMKGAVSNALQIFHERCNALKAFHIGYMDGQYEDKHQQRKHKCFVFIFYKPMKVEFHKQCEQMWSSERMRGDATRAYYQK